MPPLPRYTYEDALDLAAIVELGSVLWGEDAAETLYREDIDDAIEDLLDAPDILPESIEVWGYRPVRAELSAARVVDRVLDDLDADYGGPGTTSSPTPAITAAAEALVAAVLADYQVQMCEPVCVVTVCDVRGWVLEHCPEWLDLAEVQS